MFVFFALTLPGEFLTYDNLIGITANQTIAAIVAMGLLIPLTAGAFDVSIGGAMTLSIIVVTTLFQSTEGAMSIPLAIFITLAVGLAVGIVNGVLVVTLRIDPFIATIGSSSVLLGISQLISDGRTISYDIPTAFTEIGRTRVAGIPLPVFYTLAIAAVVWYVLEYTPWGRKLYATGLGRDAARLSGVPTDRILFAAFIASAMFATLAGIIMASRLGAGPPDIGSSYLLPAFAACFLGRTIYRPGRFNVVGLIVALFILGVGINGLQLHGIPFWVVATFQGMALIIAVVLSKLRSNSGATHATSTH
jgi:ribose transport system permease protein